MRSRRSTRNPKVGISEPDATAQRPWLSRIVRTHTPRQPRSWLTWDVGRRTPMVAVSIFAEDKNHPIPSVDTCDVYGIMKGGGAKLVIVIASPIDGDTRSLERLMKKMDHYLGFIASETFLAECGPPSPQNTVIEVFIHPDSDRAAFDLLERSRDWVSDGRARLVIRKKANQTPEPTAPSGRGSS